MEKLENFSEDVEKVKVLNLEENDILVFTTKQMLSNNVLGNIRKAVEYMGIKNKVMVLEEGMDIKVIKEKEVIL